MSTTIDLLDCLFREVKATAARRGITLKDFIATAPRAALYPRTENDQAAVGAEQLHHQRMAAWFVGMSQNRDQTAPVGPLDRDSLHDRDA